ncbi:hypothetical protein LRS03_13575 [Rhizobacter sp. J219]|uniref:hypothetical protein n=1 Tax=Rhizobacter sp. J219 TaxID=2898430 RepID=UPI002151EFD0|nr:hypothetical protein [Rhizobacter sp. J219]MCR5883830.1 hypothetical protein [Rhizobacter sp. J219]
MKNFAKKLALAAALAASLPASAAMVSVVDLAGNTDFIDFSAEGLAAFDLGLLNVNTVRLSLSFTAAEIAAGSVAFNTQLANLSGLGVPGVRFGFGTLAVTPGTVRGGFDNAAYAVQAGSGEIVALRTAGLEYYSAVVGDPLLSGAPLVDWTIDTSGLSASTAYDLNVAAVPVPGAALLLASGLAALGVGARRRREAKR